MQDYEELQKEPVENVSAMPLDANVFEWHCNFKHDDIIYHLLLFFTEKYPYESPSAEFVPVGFQYNSGATMAGKVGTKVCLNISRTLRTSILSGRTRSPWAGPRDTQCRPFF